MGGEFSLLTLVFGFRLVVGMFIRFRFFFLLELVPEYEWKMESFNLCFKFIIRSQGTQNITWGESL